MHLDQFNIYKSDLSIDLLIIFNQVILNYSSTSLSRKTKFLKKKMNLIEIRVGLKNIGASDCTIVVSYHYAIFIIAISCI